MTTTEQAKRVLVDLRTAFTRVKVSDIDAALVALVADNEKLRRVLIDVHNNHATWTGQTVIKEALGEKS